MSESEFDQAASATAQTLSGADFLDRVVGHANGCPIVCACPMVWWRPLLGRPTRMRRDSLGWLILPSGWPEAVDSPRATFPVGLQAVNHSHVLTLSTSS